MKKSAIGAITALVAILTVMPVAVEAAGSEPAYQPDGRIRVMKTTSELFGTYRYDTPSIGDNRYNTTAYRQTVRESWCCDTPGWQRWIFGVSVQNDGTNSDRVRIQATGNQLEGWTVKYFHGRTNITEAVVAGTFTTSVLAPEAEYVIKVKVRRAADNYDTGNLRRLISLTSVGDASKSDAVKLVMEHWVCTC